MLKILKKSWLHYRKNFLFLVVSFCVTAIPLQLIAIFSPDSITWQLFIGFLFVLGFFLSASFDTLAVRNLNESKRTNLLSLLKGISTRLIQLFGLGGFIFCSLILTLYLLAQFLNFVFSLATLFIPVFLVFALPEILINESGLIGGLRKSVSLSWDNLLRTATLVLIPGVIIIYLWFSGFWIFAWCFLIPFLVVSSTELYLSLTPEQSIGQEEK